jgi:hypothetical protein
MKAHHNDHLIHSCNHLPYFDRKGQKVGLRTPKMVPKMDTLQKWLFRPRKLDSKVWDGGFRLKKYVFPQKKCRKWNWSSSWRLKLMLKLQLQLKLKLRYVEVELWRGPQAAQNSLGPSNLIEWLFFRCTTTLPKGFDPLFWVWNTSGRVQEGILAPNGA